MKQENEIELCIYCNKSFLEHKDWINNKCNKKEIDILNENLNNLKMNTATDIQGIWDRLGKLEVTQ